MSGGNPYEQAGRERKAFALLNCIRDLGIRSGDVPPVEDEAFWRNLAKVAGTRIPSVSTRELVVRLAPVGECPSELSGPRHDFAPGSPCCRGCGHNPFAVFETERAKLEGRA